MTGEENNLEGEYAIETFVVQQLATWTRFDTSTSRIKVVDITHYATRAMYSLGSQSFILAKDLISECAQLKSLKNQKVKREKVSRAVKSTNVLE